MDVYNKKIVKLDSHLVNQIAAGEVIERPCAVVKELVENAIDSKADVIEICLRDGGKTFIQITDNGFGMDSQNLEMAFERHATSKLQDQDLFNIQTLGFRGEALPSIASVSRLKAISKLKDQTKAWCLEINGGQKQELVPTAFSKSTQITVRDLFYCIPARLKFLKSSSTELSHCREILEKLAIVNYKIEFILKDDEKIIFHYPKATNIFDRLKDILGKNFCENLRPIDVSREDIKIRGYLGLPTFNHSQNNYQYFFVNNRAVKDKFLQSAIKVAYQDYLENHRFPSAVVFIDIDPKEVDVNVHPAKSEVRFRDSQLLRGFFISSCKTVLSESGNQASSHITKLALDKIEKKTFLQTKPITTSAPIFNQPSIRQEAIKNSHFAKNNFNTSIAPSFNEEEILKNNIENASFISSGNLALNVYENDKVFVDSSEKNFEDHIETKEQFLGIAKAQLFKTYVLAVNEDEVIIVDQHAAHERIVFEDFKDKIRNQKIFKQSLLIPEVMEINHSHKIILEKNKENFEKIGFSFDWYGDSSLVIREVPSFLKDISITNFFKDILDDMIDNSFDEEDFHNIFSQKLSSQSCHGSIRAGKILSNEEMNALLRQIENNKNTAQCNHGRPTYIKISKSDIEKLFGRK